MTRTHCQMMLINGRNVMCTDLFETLFQGLRETDIKIESNVDGLFDMCKETQAGVGIREPVARGWKRKLDADSILDDVYVPPKRISPFLNTPKEKKDERKKILKLSIKKLKQLEDPESFLRRTVLVNNTRKRIQNELKNEKVSGRKCEFGYRKSYMASYDVLSNSCLANSYLFDDPFLSGVHEKITDDMTDTLINNLKDKLCDTIEEAMDTSSPSFCAQSGPSAHVFNIDSLYNSNAFSCERKSKPCSADNAHEHKIEIKVCEFQALNKVYDTSDLSKPAHHVSSKVCEQSSCLDWNVIPRRCFATTQSVVSLGESTDIDTRCVAEMPKLTNDNEPGVSLAAESANACQQVPAEFNQWKSKHFNDVHVYSHRVHHNRDIGVSSAYTESLPVNHLSGKVTSANSSNRYNNTNHLTNSDRTQGKCCLVPLDLNSNFPCSNSLLSENLVVTSVIGSTLGSASMFDPNNITLCKPSSQHSCSPVSSDSNKFSMHTCQC
ncbi:uncharacterized protein LOC127869315 isoform X2 [Dreissena polymorpha]|uniref:uncharacterized protein LOC127869315 isoform X2 n=1 Tax=Dreissena polymorpha TaxID=45954 RepID=UPI002264B728|nr:uncharacterized protein LOC127869315 isoform X2 [Dreissena polymorpha]